MTLGKRVTRLEGRHGGDPYEGIRDKLVTLLTKRKRTLGVVDHPLSIKELENFTVQDGPPAFIAKAILKSRGHG